MRFTAILYPPDAMVHPLTSSERTVLAMLTAPEVGVPPGWMIGAATRLLDSWTPMIEIIRVPAISFGAGEVVVSMCRGAETFEVSSSRLGRVVKTLVSRARRTVRRAELVLDLRFDSCKNLAHACCVTGPMALAARSVAKRELGRDDLVLIVRHDAPDYYTNVLALLGFLCVRSASRIAGDILYVETRGNASGERVGRPCIPLEVPAKLEEQDPGLGPSLFISRRGARSIQNEAQICTLLARRGFRTVYLEDYPPMQQLAAVCRAQRIVAIHGAAMGPLLLRQTTRGLPRPKLVEIFGPGYIITMGRFICAMVGIDWIGVRGRILPEVVRDVDLRGNARSHQASPFYVDPQSVEIALDTVERGYPEPDYRVVM